MASENSKWLARLLNRNPFEVEKVWRKAKRYCSHAGSKGDYLKILNTTLVSLKARERCPDRGDTISVSGVTLTLTDASASFATLKAADSPPVLLPLWALPFTG